MAEIGYTLSCEEHGPNDLVRNARRAEEVGFTFAMISDHFHPWIDAQGQSPFAWSVLGGIAQVTQRLQVGTGVTCPIVRYPPAIVAQAAATIGAMMPGRFFLGLGAGERLNEHILGTHWPSPYVRHDMLAEAVDIIRTLWEGGLQSYYGTYFTVEEARIYTLPDPLPPIYIAAAGKHAADLAGEIGDGLISTSPDKPLLRQFDAAGGVGKPRYGQVTVCWAQSEQEARKTACEQWPTSGLPGQLGQELPIPSVFEQAVKIVTEDELAKQITCGPDPQRHVQAIQQFIDAGYDHVCVHQVGKDQEGFFQFYQREVLPKLG